MKIHNNIMELHYKTHNRRLVKVVRRRLSNSWALAEEAVQEAYKRGLEYIHCYDPEKSLDNWFITILNNSVRDTMKAERNRGMFVGQSCDFNNESEVRCAHSSLTGSIQMDVHLSEEDLLERIFLVKNNLHKEVLELYIIKGLGYKDIVQVTEASSEAMVRKVVSRFKEEINNV